MGANEAGGQSRGGVGKRGWIALGCALHLKQSTNEVVCVGQQAHLLRETGTLTEESQCLVQ